MKIRMLNAQEIEVKIGRKDAEGFSVVLYKNARVDSAILDETFGMFNWRNKFEEIGGNLYCTVEVYDDNKGEWIGRVDVGSTKNKTEKEKSLATDAFKRACFKLGIGTELYNINNVFVKCNSMIKRTTESGTYYESPYEKIYVKEIEFNEDKKLIKLVLAAGKEIIYSYEIEKPKFTEDETTKAKAEITREILTQSKKAGITPPMITRETTMEQLKEIKKNLKGEGNDN